MDFRWIRLSGNCRKEIKKIIFYGTGGKKLRITYTNYRGTGSYDYAFEGIIPNLQRRYSETSETMRGEYEEYMTNIECPSCHGMRLQSGSSCHYGGWKKYFSGHRNVCGRIFRNFSRTFSSAAEMK